MTSTPAAESVGARTYREHLLGTATALYLAARTEHTLSLDDLDIVLSARRAVLDLLAAVHADLTGLENVRPLHPNHLESHPVEALGRALRRYPRPAGQLSPTEVALATPASAAGLAWQQAARHAVVAHHVWTAGVGEPLSPDARWAGMADVASLADALARLDLGLLLTTAEDPRCPAFTSTLRGGLHQALGVAARETLRLAAQGELPDVGPDRAQLPALEVAPVRTATDLPRAQQRLAVLLEHGGRLRPERFPALASLYGRACLRLADSLRSRAQPPLGLDGESVQAALRRHARALHQATLRRSGIASIVAGDDRPLRQAAEIDGCLQRDPGRVTSDAALLGDVVIGLAGSTRALAAAVSRALESGDWMVPDDGLPLTAPLWHPWHPADPTPAAVSAIRRAAADSVELAQAVAPPTPGLAPRRPPLAAVVSAPGPRPAVPDKAADLLRLAIRRPRLPAYALVPADGRSR